MDDCPPSSLDPIASRELPCGKRRAAAGKPYHVVPIGRGVHAGGRGASIAYLRSGRIERGVPVSRVARLAYAMCGLVAVIAVLMEVKPF